MTNFLQRLHPHVQPHGLTAGNRNLRACAAQFTAACVSTGSLFSDHLAECFPHRTFGQSPQKFVDFRRCRSSNSTQLTTLVASMLSSPGEAACNCTIASAQLLLEASGFVVSGRHSLCTGSSYSAIKRDEVFTMYCAIVAGLVLIAGLMSGLTLGLMSLDGLDLEV